MGDVTENILTRVFVETGHIYVTNQGYVAIHCYVNDIVVADFLQRQIHGRVRPHLRVYDVIVSKRGDLEYAARHLLGCPLSEQRKQELSLVLQFATTKDSKDRHGIATRLAELLAYHRIERRIKRASVSSTAVSET